MSDLIRPLRAVAKGGSGDINLLAARAADEIERLRNGFREIMKATVEGRVCDDVAWFDTITTLYDFCDLFLPSPTHERGADVETKTDAS